MLYLVLFSAFFGVLIYAVAAQRNANKPFWLAMGLLLGPFALPFVFFTKTSNMKPECYNNEGSDFQV